ncbi:MAG TPA: [protein-PII] uridylyltransferase, partial [Friedmanniella sp.]
MTACVEEGLVGLWSSAGAPPSGVALACVGSLARRELGPRSDLDLVLLHDGRQPRTDGGLDGLSERLWYPLWDARIKMDHSVRTPAECTAVAAREVSAGVGLLDLRVVAGDGALVAGTRTALLTAWRTNARRRLAELLDSLDERLAKAGDAAYLLEPDLKEARGGFRDMTMLRALAATWLTDRPHGGVEAPYERLLDVRDALHLTSGRAVDRLLATEVDEVAQLLGFADPDDLRREVSLGARRIAHAVDLTVRAARQSVPQRRVLSFGRRERRPEYRTAEHGLIVTGSQGTGEVGLARVDTADDPLAGLWVGALAAREGLTISPVTAENLGARVSPLPDPWPEAARDAFVTMLASGPSLLPVWEALDLAGCITCWLPEWSPIRARPQHNPVHRHTVDRHSVQTVVEAHRHLTQVDRPDLLLLAALLHDIGKLPGAGVRHPAVGAPIARAAVDRIGLTSEDADLVALLVREHLTLAELATRRDHADPKTQDALVAAVEGRSDVLALLRFLTEADARAAGPAAWSPWRASLISSLADQVEGMLVDGQPEDRSVDLSRLVDLDLAHAVARDGRPRVRVEPRTGGAEVLIAAPDRLGLFSDTAGLLAAARVQVRAAVLHTVDGVSVNTWRIDKERVGDLPDAAYLATQLERLAAGDRGALEPVRRRESRAQPSPAQVHVEAVGGASESASVLEVRTGDRSGLLWALGASLSDAGLSIRSAHVSTLAGQAIDTFYVTEPDGRHPDP